MVDMVKFANTVLQDHAGIVSTLQDEQPKCEGCQFEEYFGQVCEICLAEREEARNGR